MKEKLLSSKINIKYINKVHNIFDNYYEVGSDDREKILSSLRKDREKRKTNERNSKNKKKKVKSKKKGGVIRVSSNVKSWLENKLDEKDTCNSINDVIEKMIQLIEKTKNNKK